MTDVSPERKTQRKGVLSQKETDAMLKKAGELKPEYFCLRARALVSLGKTGKRRAEVASLEVSDLRVEGEWLYITFTVVKKRRRKHCQSCGKTSGASTDFCRFCGTSLSHIEPKPNIMSLRRTKRFQGKSRYAQYIMEYLAYMKEHHAECKWLFPSGRCIFGVGYTFNYKRHLSGRQVLRIIQILNPKAWFHLFRETRGADIVRADERKYGEAKLLTVYRVKRALDLEREETAWRYINRYATETIETEEETE